jgi:hypothetical protein
MTAPLALHVPAPVLDFKPLAGSIAPLEEPVTVSFAAIRFPDGSAMTPADYAAAQVVVSRVIQAGGAAEVWDGSAKTWRSAAATDLSQVAGLPVIPPSSPAEPWKGILLGSGEKDSAGAPWIRAAVGHYPRYTVRGSFRGIRAGAVTQGVGPESPPIEFASAAELKRFGVALTPDPETATRARLALRTAGGQALGTLDIDASGGDPVVTLSNQTSGGATLARIRLEADGGITLIPASGRRVVIQGDLEAEHVRYLPTGAGVKADL